MLVFGVGLCKTGTRSLAEMFADKYVTRHEPNAKLMAKAVIEGQSALPHIYEAIGRTIQVQASQYNAHCCHELIKLQRAKFVLTVREPVAWLTSLANHIYYHQPVEEITQRFRDFRFSIDDYPAEEQPLVDLIGYSLEGMLRYWENQNREVIKTIPSSRLLIVKTQELSESISRLADFLEIPQANIKPKHENRALSGVNCCECLPADYIAERAKILCPLWPELALQR